MKKSISNAQRMRDETAEFVIASVKDLGLTPHPASRLMRMHRVLTVTPGIIGPNHPDFETALEADRDMQLLAFVFDQAAARPSDMEFRRLVEIALKDSALPQNDREQSKGRDAQFELFVGAVCQSAGMVPVAREEPDVTCTADKLKFGIAAKRIKNASNLGKRVREAANQIQKAGLPGIIALDTCVALNRDNRRITTPIPDELFGPLHKDALKSFIRHYHDRIQNWVRGKGVRGLVFHDHQVRLLPSGEWSLESMTMTLCTARKNQRRKREFETFDKRYIKGLPNIVPA